MKKCNAEKEVLKGTWVEEMERVTMWFFAVVIGILGVASLVGVMMGAVHQLLTVGMCVALVVMCVRCAKEE